MTRKRPPIVAIRGSHDSDLITQEELAELAVLQDAEWIASRAAQKAALSIETRIAHGAVLEGGPLDFDKQRHMVRSRGKATG
jgi:hypothetical protein